MDLLKLEKIRIIIMIEVRDLSKNFGKLSIFEGVNYTFNISNVYGVIGDNGAGKSTFFRCLTGIEQYEGDIFISENCKIGVLADTPFFYTFMTGFEYIEFCLRARNIKISKDAIENLNKKFALPLDKYASKYSLGMKKRLMLMAIMLQNNDVIIMDEPFNGLDLIGTIILKQWIKDMRERKKCIILSSHIISSLTDICDEIIYIHNGKFTTDFSGMSSDEIEHKILDGYLSTDR